MLLQKIKMQLRYDPVDRKGNKSSAPWWLLAMSDCDVDAYLAWFFKKETGIELQRPKYGPHVTIVSGEKPPTVENWGWMQGIWFDVYLDQDLRSSGHHWWVRAHAPEFILARQKLGLAPYMPISFHLTLGYPMPTWAEESKVVHNLRTKNAKPAKLPWFADMPNLRYCLDLPRSIPNSHIGDSRLCIECERGLIFDEILACSYCGKKYLY